jgi:8-oxo-dGTP pyrophosphatase MutT (NUDIX family)
MADPAPIPAATVIILREAPSGPPELLMVERAAAMAFAPGALVFPGGRVDPGDRALASTFLGDPDEVAAQIAAIRETLEEAGLALGLDLDPAATAAARARLHAGEPIAAVLEGRVPDLDALVPFARWLPLGLPHRVFDTRFYLVRAPRDAAPVVDGSENVRLFWSTAQAVLDRADRAEASLIFPTRRNLERLARFASFDEAAADAARYPVRTITPWIEPRGGIDHLCIPEDAGYPMTAEPLSRVRRA